MNQGRLSINYARALLHWATNSGVEQQVYEQSEDVLRLLDSNPELIEMLSSPIVVMSKKVKTLQSIMEKSAPLLSNFVILITKNGRLNLLKRILLNFQNLDRANRGIIRVTVESPKNIDPGHRENLKEFLKSRFNQEIEMKFDIDPSLIGGFVLTINDQVLDKSVKGELNVLRKQLMGIVQ